jgi:superfamily II DNA or RNA helicase
MKPRDYQESNIDQHLLEMELGTKATLSGIFTGAGKTVIFTELARRVLEQTGGRTLIMTPLRELTWQAVDKVREVIGLDPGVEMAEYRVHHDEWFSPSVVVASKQTLIRGRYKKFKDIRLVIVDEAHMQFTEPCMEMFRWFNDHGAMVAGFTATPFLMDGRAMKDYYEPLCNLDIHWAIANGWAVPPKCKLARVESLDLSEVKVQGGDFNQQQLQAAIEKEANLHRIALITSQEALGPTVVFTPSVASAKGVAHYLANNYGVKAEVVWGTQPEEERQVAIQKFKSGESTVLVNCAVVAVGFDHPKIRTMILARPTRSRSFWLQCVGRATRPLAGTVDFDGSTPESRIAAIAASGKPDFQIIDCTDASLDHRLVTAVDMFVSDTKPGIREAVKKQMAEAGEPLTQAEMDALAQQELERRMIAEEIQRRREMMTGRARGNVTSESFELDANGKRSVGTYRNPLRGKYGGVEMSKLPPWYLEWGAGNTTLKPWIRSTFRKEQDRRAKHRRALA